MLSLIVHNERFGRVTVTFTVKGANVQTVDVFDAVIWRQDNEIIDIAHYGQNLPNIILVKDMITSVDKTVGKNGAELELTAELC